MFCQGIPCSNYHVILDSFIPCHLAINNARKQVQCGLTRPSCTKSLRHVPAASRAHKPSRTAFKPRRRGSWPVGGMVTGASRRASGRGGAKKVGSPLLRFSASVKREATSHSLVQHVKLRVLAVVPAQACTTHADIESCSMNRGQKVGMHSLIRYYDLVRHWQHEKHSQKVIPYVYFN